VIITTPGFFKKSDPRKVFEAFRAHGGDCRLMSRPDEALKTAEGYGGALLIMGSFFLAGEILKIYGETL
jgi:folylpolyglutamate synthase/dihydropteroate synthase